MSRFFSLSRKRSPKELLSTSALAVALVFGAACGGDSASNASNAAPAGTPADLGQADAVYTADTGASQIAWKGSKLYELDSHNGTIGLQSGQLGFKDGAPIAGKFTIDMTSIANSDIADPEYNAKLVGHLKNDDFFSVDKFPTAVFEVVSVAAGANANEYTVTGNLTVKGITKSVSGPATITTDAAGAQAEAKLNIDRTEFDVQYGSENAFADLAKDKVIDDKVEISLNVKLTK